MSAKVQNAFMEKSKGQEPKADSQTLNDASAAEPDEDSKEIPKQKTTRSRTPKSGTSKPKTTKKTIKTNPEDEELVTANFKIPASYRRKLKMYAVANDTTTVAVLKEMIDKLPNV